MNVLGLCAFFHESSCCLLSGGELVAAAAEERFTRVKHDPGLPVEAFRFCLRAGGIQITDLDAVAYYESPRAKLSRQLERAFEWCVNEEAMLREVGDVLVESSYDVPDVCDSDTMSDAKRRFNNVIAAAERLANEVEVEEPWHFSVRWQ